MSFEFTENITLELPNASEKVKSLNEADKGKRNKILTEIAAIHVGLTSNYNMYTEDALTKSLQSWVDPYPKPIIVNHDEYSDPLGRVMGAKMQKEADGTPYIAIQAAIISPGAIERVLDERYITGSVGGKAESALCSICGVDWAQAEGTGMPCRHRRGKIYEGKLAYFELRNISWREYSFVNIPADKKSHIKAIVDSTTNASEDESNWVRSVKVYSLDMNEEAILTLNDEEPHNILTEMKKVDAAFAYRNIKGTFLTTTAFDYAQMLEKENDQKITFIQNDTTIESESVENDHVVASEENNDMSKNDEVVQEEEDNILDVVDSLRAENDSEDTDLSANEDENQESEETETEESAESSSQEETDSVEDTEEVVEEEAQSDEAATTDEETVEEEAKIDEEETSNTQPENEEASETDENEVQDLVGSEDAVSHSSEEEENANENTENESDNDSALEELQAKVNQLAEENAKLKKHLHYMLAERVVDAKITVGLVQAEERADALKEHETRTASSLGDALKDLQRMHPVSAPKGAGNPMNVKAHAVEGESQVVTKEDDEAGKIAELSPVERLENIVFEALTGRKSL